MIPEASQHQINTRHLELPATVAPAAKSETGPLDLKRPWVVEFRVVGTASTIQTRVGDTMVIGRGDATSGFKPAVDLGGYDAFSKGVSRKHALITIKDQRLMLRDLNSTNGTRLNNIVCKPGEEYRLRHGNEIMLGTLRLQVSFAVVPAVTDTQRVAPTDKASMLPFINGNGKRVLIIEDDEDVGNVFRMALESAGYSVMLVPDITKALGVVFQGMPDAIVLDMMVSDMNGLDLVRYVRKQKTSRHVPMLVVSSAVGGFHSGQAISAGADIFLGKPVAVEELVRAVGSTLAIDSAALAVSVTVPITAPAASIPVSVVPVTERPQISS